MTTNNDYLISIPYTAYMDFSVELPAGLTEEAVYALIKANYQELIDINTIDFECLDRQDVMYELGNTLNNDELQHDIKIEEVNNS